MKPFTMKKAALPIAAMILASFAFAASAAIPEETFKRIRQQQTEARKKLEAAEHAEGAKQAALLDEHAKMVQSMLNDMRAMKPAESMSMAEHTQWIHEHQKLMDELLTQMVRDHELMMKNCPHKH